MSYAPFELLYLIKELLISLPKISSVRLPSSTRFPPRGRNLASATSTTYVPEVSSETVRQRGRSQSDNVADESIGQTRSRTRAHIR